MKTYDPILLSLKYIKRNFGASLGFGEVKVSFATTDNYDLCHDLLRLGTFSKETIDMNKLPASMTFQIHGFHITFFIKRLRHDGIYIMQEIGQVAFPRSLEELGSFVNLNNIRILLKVNESFWMVCQPLDNAENYESKRCSTHPGIYSSKDRHRSCSLRLE